MTFKSVVEPEPCLLLVQVSGSNLAKLHDLKLAQVCKSNLAQVRESNLAQVRESNLAQAIE